MCVRRSTKICHNFGERKISKDQLIVTLFNIFTSVIHTFIVAFIHFFSTLKKTFNSWASKASPSRHLQSENLFRALSFC